MKRYLVSYRHEGGEWNIDLPAASLEDARDRLRRLAYGKVEGEVVATIPGSMGPIAVFSAWCANIFRGARR